MNKHLKQFESQNSTNYSDDMRTETAASKSTSKRKRKRKSPPKKTGRPELGVEKKTERINVMGTVRGRKIIEAKARSVNMSVSAFLYALGLSKKIIPPPPAVNLEMMLDINRIGYNLNALVRLMRTARQYDRQTIQLHVDAIHKKISKVNALLIGKSLYEESEIETHEIDFENMFDDLSALESHFEF